MAKAGVIEIDLQASTARFQSDMKKATAALNSNVSHMKRSTDSLKKSFDALNNSAKFLAAGLVGSAVAQVAGNVLKAADSFNQLNGRIKNSLDSVTQFNAVFQQLVASSNRSGASIDAVAQAFVRIRPAAQELGKSNGELIRFNETLAKMGALAGVNSEEFNNAMIQLSQGIASNRLGGDELRSVMEQMPPVARAISDELIKMGKIKSFAEFKNAAKEGQITAEVVLNAIQSKTDEVDAKFAELPGSIDRSMNKIVNSLSIFVGKMNETLDITGMVSEGMDNVAGFVDNLTKSVNDNNSALSPMIDLLKDVGGVMGVVIDTIRVMWNATNDFFKVLFGGISIMDVFKGALNGIISFVDGLAVSARLAAEAIGSISNAMSRVTQGDFKGALHVMQKGVTPGGMSQIAADARERFANRFNPQYKPHMQSNTISGMPLVLVPNKRNKSTTILPEPDGGIRSGRGNSSHTKSAAEKEMDRLKRAADQLKDSVKDIWTKEAETIAEADKLLKLHLITAGEYEQAVNNAKNATQNAFKIEGVKETLDALFKPAQTFLDDFDTSLSDALSDTGFQEVQKVIQDTMTPLEKYGQQVEYLNYLHENAGLATETWQRALKSAQDDLDASTKKGQDFAAAIGNITAEFGDKFFDTFTQGMKDGKFAFKDFVASALEDLAKLIFKLTVTIPLANALTSALSGTNAQGAAVSSGGGKPIWRTIFENVIPSIAGAAMGSGGGTFATGSAAAQGLAQGITFAANGANASAGQPFIVGEKGPEFFVPKTAGTIVPNGQSFGGGGGQPIVVHINNNYSLGVQQTVRAEIAAMRPQMEKDTIKAMQAAVSRGGKTAQSMGLRS